MTEISDETFTKEIQIFWQNSDVDIRNILRNAIYDYYGFTKRARAVINKMQIYTTN